MPSRPEVLDHLGPYTQHGPIAALCELSERVWRTYNGLTAGYIHSDPNSREYLFLRMLYIAELTSTAVRLNSTWGLTHPAMSLLRDRYEQTIRFSWLVRNPDQSEFEKYERFKVAKINSIVRSLGPDTIQRLEAYSAPLRLGRQRPRPRKNVRFLKSGIRSISSRWHLSATHFLRSQIPCWQNRNWHPHTRQSTDSSAPSPITTASA